MFCSDGTKNTFFVCKILLPLIKKKINKTENVNCRMAPEMSCVSITGLLFACVKLLSASKLALALLKFFPTYIKIKV